MKYPISFIFLTLLCSIFAQALGADLEQKIEILNSYIENREGKIFQTQDGILAPGCQKRFSVSLLDDRNYRLYLVSDQEIKDVELTIKLEHPKTTRKLITECEVQKTGDIFFKQWDLMTFYKSSALITVEVLKTCTEKCRYAWILSSCGRDEFELPKKGIDGLNHVYELDGSDTVYKDGRKFYKKKGVTFVGLCITPKGTLYLQAEDGDIYSHNGLLYRSKNRHIIKMVSGTIDRIYMLTSDGEVFSQTMTLYKRKEDKKAVDLFSENGQVWIVTKEGERIFLIKKETS